MPTCPPLACPLGLLLLVARIYLIFQGPKKLQNPDSRSGRIPGDRASV
jgi:hypothetical protein